MDKRDSIIEEVEKWYGVKIESYGKSTALCNGDNCRSDECECWETYKYELQVEAENLVLSGMTAEG